MGPSSLWNQIALWECIVLHRLLSLSDCIEWCCACGNWSVFVLSVASFPHQGFFSLFLFADLIIPNSLFVPLRGGGAFVCANLARCLVFIMFTSLSFVVCLLDSSRPCIAIYLFSLTSLETYEALWIMQTVFSALGAISPSSSCLSQRDVIFLARQRDPSEGRLMTRH